MQPKATCGKVFFANSAADALGCVNFTQHPPGSEAATETQENARLGVFELRKSRLISANLG
jgi:hypothetical protein